MILQDKLPFNFVNGHGFVRFCQGMNPKWDCGSASYYSRLTDINYEKVKSKLKAKLKEENPPKVTISTDGWTQRHDAFLGINGYYIDKNWIRKKIYLGSKNVLYLVFTKH